MSSTGKISMICENCYYQSECNRKPSDDDRCNFYVKGSKVKLKEDSEVDPMATGEFDVEDFRELIRDIERRR
jgi:hypothetical protein